MCGVRSRSVVAALAMGLCLPLLVGQGCPVPGGNGGDGNGDGNNNGGNNQPTTLLSTTLSMTGAAAAIAPADGGCATAAPRGIQTTFNNTAVNKLVTVSVTGPTTNSRPQIRVRDILSNNVALTTNNTTQTQTTSFTGSAVQIYVLEVNECAGAGITGNYTLLVTQAP